MRFCAFTLNLTWRVCFVPIEIIIPPYDCEKFATNHPPQEITRISQYNLACTGAKLCMYTCIISRDNASLGIAPGIIAP